MEKFCRPPFQKGHIVTVAQGLFDGLEPEQALTRRMLFDEELMLWAEATTFVRKIGPDISGLLRAQDPDELRMSIIEQRFIDAGPALQSWYLN